MANMLTMPPSKAVAALTPKESGTSPLPPAAPKPAANALATNAMGNTAMTPQKSPYAAAMAPKPQSLVNGAIDGFMRGFRPEQWQADQDKTKLDGAERAKQTLALMQQQRQIPAEQRAQWWQQNADQIGQIVGADVKSLPMDANSFSDQALDGQIAMMSAKLGIAPATPEPMTAYQLFQKEQAEAAAKKPTYFNTADGVVSIGEDGKGTLAYDAPNKPADLPEGMWYGPDGKGQPQPIPGYEGMRGRIAAAGRAPSDGQDTYRPATAEDRARWGLPPEGAFKINQRTGEPAAISGARAASDYSPTEVRGFRDKADGLLTLKNAVQKYVSTLEEMGGPQLLDTPLNAKNSQALKTAHALITSAIKQADTLGALDQGVQNLVNSIIQDPVGWGTFGKSTDSIKQGASQLYDSIDFKLSRVPEEYRNGSTGAAPPEQPTPQYTPKEVTQAKLALQNWDYLPASMRTPQARALAEKVAGVAKPTAEDASDDDILSALGLK